MAGPRFGLEPARQAVAAILKAAEIGPADHVVVGCNPKAGLTAAAACPGARLVLGSGPDGADRALVRAVDAGHIARRYGRLVVASGDHAFAGLTREVRRRGLRVTVVGRAGAISWELVPAADQVLTLVGLS